MLLAISIVVGPGGLLARTERTQAQETATLSIQKVNIGGSASEVFTGSYSGPVSGTFSVSESQPFNLSVPTGTYTITEDPPVGSTPVGGFTFSPLDSTRCTSSPFGGAPTYAQPGPVNITLSSDDLFPPKVCLLNERGTLSIHKANFGGSPSEVFTGTYSGPVSGTFSVSEGQPFTLAVPLGTYTITEDAPFGSTYFGGFTYAPYEPFRCSSSPLIGTPNSAQAGAVSVTLTSGDIFPPQVCLVNGRGTLSIQKVNLGGSASEVFTGTYSGPVSGTFSVSQNQPFELAVPLGTYTITEDPPVGSTYVGGFMYPPYEAFKCTDSMFIGAQNFAQPGPVSVTLTIGDIFPPEVCLLNARATLSIRKVNLGGSSTQAFTGSFSGPVSGTFSVSESQPFELALPLGNYTVTEDALAGFAYIGGFTFSPLDALWCSSIPGLGAESHAQPGPVSIALGLNELFPPEVCLLNQPVSQVDVVKHDDVDAAHGGNSGQWDFAVIATGGSASFNEVIGSPRAEGTVTTTSQQFGPFNAAGTVTESAGNAVACTDQVVKTFQTSVGSPGNLGAVANFSSAPGTPAVVHFYNIDCGKVLGAGTLDVVKFNDLDGDKTQDPGEAELAWEVTVSCPGQPDLQGTTPVQFTGLPNNADCTVTETPAAGYRVIGWRASDTGTATGQVLSDGTGSTTTVHVDDGDVISVSFYNQPRVNVRAEKNELLLSGVGSGEGWDITLKGCGVDLTLTTGPAGTAMFSDLPPCAFTISEDVNSKAGFVAVGATSVQVVAMLAGETVGISFTNVDISGICVACNPRVTATPTPAVPSPTATTPPPTGTTTPPAATGTPSAATGTPSVTQPPATATVTRTPAAAVGTVAPGLTDEQRTATAVAAARTAAAGQSTPIAPRTGGAAAEGGGGQLNVALAAAGLLVLSGGLALVATRSRRR